MRATQLNRRQILELGALALMNVAARPRAAASEFASRAPSQEQGSQRFLYAASSLPNSAKQGLHIFSAQASGWTSVDFVPSSAPSSLALSDEGSTLFVTNCIGRHECLPTGSVESWAIDKQSGSLTLLSRQGLALAATHPAGLAVSRDTSLLAVAAEGSLYTLLQIGPDGGLSEPVAVRKELSVGHGAAGCTQLCFAPNGHLLAADVSRQTLSVYACAPGRFERLQQTPLPPGSAAVSYVVSEQFVTLCVWDDQAQEIAAFRYGETLDALPHGAALTRVDLPKLHPATLRLAASVPGMSQAAGRTSWLRTLSGDACCSVVRSAKAPPQAFAWVCA